MPISARNIIIYGDSIILEGARANLSACAGIRILQLDSLQELPLKTIQEWRPAIFIFDLGASQPDFQAVLLQQPGLMLVGIDPDTHQACVWTGRWVPAGEAADLERLIAFLPEG